MKVQTEQGDMNEIEEKYADSFAELEYKEAKQSEDFAQELFFEVFEFDEVEPFYNLKKVEIVEKLKELQAKAEQFDAEPD